MEQAILVASFGTTHLDTLEHNIEAVENAIARTFTLYPVSRAFTSELVRKRLDCKGVHVQSVAEALDHLVHEGVRRLVVAPTHLIRGVEYESLVDEVHAHDGDFDTVSLSDPLLSDVSDFRSVLTILAQANPVGTDEALVLMGHGTSHPSNAIYAALAYEATNLGMRQVFIGTVEGYPTLDDVLGKVSAAGYGHALITPLMLVAGDHATCDMASDDPGSWKSRFLSAGISARCLVKGLGEYADIRELYIEHVARAIGTLPKGNSPHPTGTSTGGTCGHGRACPMDA